MAGLIAEGWKVPQEIMFYGGNDDPYFQYGMPPISSFKPRYAIMAEHLVAGALDHDSYLEPPVVHAEYQPFFPN